jgi:hypothetical protein
MLNPALADCTYDVPELFGLLPPIKRQWPRKSPGEIRRYRIDFRKRLRIHLDGETDFIVSADTWLTGGDDALLRLRQRFDRSAVTYTLSGGTPGIAYTVSTLIVTNHGEELQIDMPIAIHRNSPAVPIAPGNTFTVNGLALTYGGKIVTF